MLGLVAPSASVRRSPGATLTFRNAALPLVADLLELPRMPTMRRGPPSKSGPRPEPTDHPRRGIHRHRTELPERQHLCHSHHRAAILPHLPNSEWAHGTPAATAAMGIRDQQASNQPVVGSDRSRYLQHTPVKGLSRPNIARPRQATPPASWPVNPVVTTWSRIHTYSYITDHKSLRDHYCHTSRLLTSKRRRAH